MFDKDLIKKIITNCMPMKQAQDLDSYNLGFGFLYYSFARISRAKYCVVIGSAKGFSSVCLSHSVKDNGGGTVVLIDPSLSGYDGSGYYLGPKDNRIWSCPDEVEKHTHNLGVEGIFEVINKTSKDAFESEPIFKEKEPIDVLVIDGLHTEDGVRYDLEHFGSLVKPNGIIFLHDTNRIFPDVSNYVFNSISREDYEMLNIPIEVGLTILRKRINCINIYETDQHNDEIVKLRSDENLLSNPIEGCEEYKVLNNDRLIAGFGLWEQDKYVILRGIVVNESYRRLGIGDYIIDYSLKIKNKPLILWSDNERWIEHLYLNFDAEKGPLEKKSKPFGDLEKDMCRRVTIPVYERSIRTVDYPFYRFNFKNGGSK